MTTYVVPVTAIVRRRSQVWTVEVGSVPVGVVVQVSDSRGPKVVPGDYVRLYPGTPVVPGDDLVGLKRDI